ncbi:uncharacterized protein TRIVIDRAFT_67117 [Trichoderma virens Gv29-8]|uniref:Uncharacterized protein n=1 Tax=Hypocrea virens (strain Gv29-8 / FGSC 10586) TaxID=413071 RepID=G9N545_HYPVG|nr:uncharacterized protein TRIVIDRAFT_67117 [Trichoderma virens Gv29-8]EHK17890.1 hypothetical protein TRIVIDRAFT_67117 [Trichoderma virens Gv29-8]UKZ54244.1 hypothetical protein TrVGV298_008051 [Trichoderma virens]
MRLRQQPRKSQLRIMASRLVRHARKAAGQANIVEPSIPHTEKGQADEATERRDDSLVEIRPEACSIVIPDPVNQLTSSRRDLFGCFARPLSPLEEYLFDHWTRNCSARDSIIATIISLILDEIQAGNIDASRQHVRGLAEIVHSSGGPQTLGMNGLLKHLFEKLAYDMGLLLDEEASSVGLIDFVARGGINMPSIPT